MLVTVQSSLGVQTVEAPFASVDERGRLIVGMWHFDPEAWQSAQIIKEHDG